MTTRTLTSMHVYVDSTPENITPDLALDAERVLDGRWHGWLRPLATADALSNFLYAWRRNDPNGTWGDAIEVNGALVCTRNDGSGSDEFPRAGETADGTPLYGLTGWNWISVDDSENG